MSSFIISLRKALLMSNCGINHPLVRATMRATHSSRFNYRTEGFGEIYTSLLTKSFGNQSGFILRD